MKRIVAVAIAALMISITVWVVVPAPNLIALGFAVGIPELAVPVLALFAVVSVGLALLVRGRSRIAVVALCVVALAPLVVPIVRAPGAATEAGATLSGSGIGPLRAHAIAAVDVTRDLPVALRDGTALALDLYRPHAAHTLPLLVTMYGGAWRFGSRGGDAALATWYAARGYAVAVIDYRHVPQQRFPVQLNDVDDALNAIALHADAWHVDRDRVALLGRSAGAQLALLAGERDQLVRVRAIVAYYAPTDLVRGWREPPVPDPADVRAILDAYLGGPPDAAHAAAYRAASPLDRAHAGMPPVLAIIGDRDELVRPDFQRSFAARLDALHVRNVAIELPWSNHAFDSVSGLGSSIAQEATLRFLDALL
jgi:acetyl esterase/lipase